jgi:hypothetical protein
MEILARLSCPPEYLSIDQVTMPLYKLNKPVFLKYVSTIMAKGT